MLENGIIFSISPEERKESRSPLFLPTIAFFDAFYLSKRGQPACAWPAAPVYERSVDDWTHRRKFVSLHLSLKEEKKIIMSAAQPQQGGGGSQGGGPPTVVLATGSYDRNVKFWKVPNGELQRNYCFNDSQVNCIAISPRCDLIVVGGFAAVRVIFASSIYGGPAVGASGSGAAGGGSSSSATAGMTSAAAAAGGGGDMGAAVLLPSSPEQCHAANVTAVGFLRWPEMLGGVGLPFLARFFSVGEDGLLKIWEIRPSSSATMGVSSVAASSSSYGLVMLKQFEAKAPINCAAMSLPTPSSLPNVSAAASPFGTAAPREVFVGTQFGAVMSWTLPNYPTDAAAAAVSLSSSSSPSSAATATSSSLSSSLSSSSSVPYRSVAMVEDDTAMRSLAVVPPAGNVIVAANNSGRIFVFALVVSSGTAAAGGGVTHVQLASPPSNMAAPHGGSSALHSTTTADTSNGGAAAATSATTTTTVQPQLTSATQKEWTVVPSLAAWQSSAAAAHPQTTHNASGAAAGTTASSSSSSSFRLMATFSAHAKYILRCVASPDGRYLATTSADCTVCVWHIPQPQLASAVLALTPPPSLATTIPQSASNASLAAAGPNTNNPSTNVSFDHASAAATSGSVTMDPNTPGGASGGGHPTAEGVPLQAEEDRGGLGGTLATASAGTASGAAAMMSHPPALTVTAAPPTTTTTTTAASSSSTSTNPTPSGGLVQGGAQAMRPPGATGGGVASATTNQSAALATHVVNTSRWELYRQLQGHQRWVWDCAFSLCATYLVTASSDHTARLWHLTTGKLSVAYNGHQKSVTCIALEERTV